MELSSLSLVKEGQPVSQTPSWESSALSAPVSNAPSHLEFEISCVERQGNELDQKIEDVPEGKYRDLLARFPDILKPNFKTEEPKNGIKHRIRTGSHPPCRAKPRQLLPGSPKAEAGYKAWKQLVDLGIVEPVDPAKPNNWSSPLHLAPKPGGGLRPVGDYRLLNQKTELDLYPLPDLRGYTHKIAGSTIFSKLDLAKAFHQILIDPTDRHKTCVSTPWGLFNFRRLAMGMMNSSQSFQRHIDDLLKNISGCFVYLDDVLVFSDNEEDHLATIEEIFNRLDAAGLTLSLSKCEFGRESLDYLGYTISAQGLVPIKKKVESLKNFPSPLKQKQLLGFLGALNYYRSSLPKSQPSGTKPARSPAQILDPLYKIATDKEAKKNFKKIWEADIKYSEAFNKAKELLVNAVNLNFPVPSAPLALTTDASQTCLGAALDQ